MTFRVELRTDLRVRDNEQLLLRFNDDLDEVKVLRLALANAAAYRSDRSTSVAIQP